jgi:C-methyltransferase C-terminal domain/Methyltransferase domain
MPGSPAATSTRCIVCASSNIVPILEIPDAPVDTIRLWRASADACSAPRAKIGVTYCEDCGHLFNSYYDDLASYETDYENSQIFSPRFRRYAEELSDRLISAYNLRQQEIVEIGGGRGDFLRILCDRGNNRGISFDPSYCPAPGEDVPANVSFVTDYYTAKYAEVPASLIICRQVLEHLQEPRSLIETVRQAVGDRKDLVVYFEVPNGEFILREQVFWEFIYQHPSYFTQSSLAKLFTMCGFQICAIRENFGGQFLEIEASVESAHSNESWSPEGKASTAVLALALAATFREKVANWRDILERLKAQGRRVVAWGAGAKATTFLNIVDPAGSVISHVVDINPRKTGRFVPGTGQRIIEPDELRELRPDIVILMNELYRDEIISQTAGLGINPEFLAA